MRLELTSGFYSVEQSNDNVSTEAQEKRSSKTQNSKHANLNHCGKVIKDKVSVEPVEIGRCGNACCHNNSHPHQSHFLATATTKQNKQTKKFA